MGRVVSEPLWAYGRGRKELSEMVAVWLLNKGLDE